MKAVLVNRLHPVWTLTLASRIMSPTGYAVLFDIVNSTNDRFGRLVRASRRVRAVSAKNRELTGAEQENNRTETGAISCFL